MAVIGSLSVKLGLVTVEWDKATAKAKAQAKDLQTAFSNLGVNMNGLKNLFQQIGGAAGLSVAGFAAMSAAIFDMAGKMQDLSDATGVSSAKILQFQNALVIAGGKAEDAQTIIGTLFSKISAAQDGNDTAIAQFEQLGISFAELKRLSPDEALKRVYEGLSQVGSSFEKVKNIKELLGKAGLGKSVDDIAKALQGSTKEFEKQARALKQWDDMGDALTQTMFNLKIAIAEMLAPFTTSKVATVDQFKSAFIAIGSAVVVGQIFNLVAAFKALNTALKGTAALSVALGALKGGKGAAMGVAALAAYVGAMKTFGDEEEEKNTGGATGTWENQPAVQGKDGDKDGGKEGGNQAAAMRAKLALYKQQTENDMVRLDLQRDMLRGDQTQLKIAESIAQKEIEIAQASSDRSQALAKENLTSEQRGLIEDEYKAKISRANGMHNARVDLLEAQRELANQLAIQETGFLKQRNALEERSGHLEETRRSMSEAGYQQSKAQLELNSKMLQISQERQRYEEEKSGAKDTVEYQQQMAKFAERERYAQAQYATQSRIITNEEKVRLDLLRIELGLLDKRGKLTLEDAELNNKARNMSEFDVRRESERISLAQKMADIDAQRENLRATRQDTASEEYQSELQRLNNMESLARQESKIRLDGIALDKEEAMSWAAGWEAALRDFGKNVERYGDVARNMFDSVVSNMNSAIDNFVRTGKLSFGDLARSIIQDLIAIQLKAQAAFLLKAALGGMGFTAKAGGGAVSQNIPYMVGENGPELFVPQTGGSIVPNTRLGEASGMGGQTINYNGPYIANMSAIDTQSATQFLSKNKMSVWSANQSAQRSVPQSR
jgi:lambda family phage tail tape measure protein